MAKIMHQLNISFPPTPTMGEVPYGQIVKYNGKYVMRLKPTQFLLNSNLVGDVLNRGDCFVCNIESGTLYIVKKDSPVTYENASFYIPE